MIFILKILFSNAFIHATGPDAARKSPDTMIIFENDNYRVHVLEGDSDYFLVTFSGLRAEEITTGSFFAERACRKLGIACAGIVSKNQDWYTSDGIDQAIAAVRLRARHHKIVYGYGNSMGAYCAIRYSRALNFRACIALAPKWSLDPDDVVVPAHLEVYFTPQMRGMSVRAEQMTGLLHIVIDEQEDIDRVHAEHFRRVYPEARIVTLPRCGHNVAAHIKGTLQLQAMLATIENPVEFQGALRRIRRSNIESLAFALSSMVERKPRIVQCALQSRRAETTGLRGFIHKHRRDIVGMMAFNHMRAGDKANCIRLMTNSLPPIGMAAHPHHRDANVLFSHIGEYVCYNPITAELSSSKGTVPANGFPLATIGRQLVGLAWGGHVTVGLDIERDSSSGFASIVKDGHYVSVLPSGEIVNNRTAKDTWEMFLPIPMASV